MSKWPDTLPDYDQEKGVDVDVEETGRRGSGGILTDNIPEGFRRGSINKITALVAEDHTHDIKYRSMSWQKASWLLAGDQVCLAIMAQTWSLSVLGWVPGLITMFGAGILFWITSMTMHKFIMKYPQIKDICDFAYYACGKSRAAYEFAGIMLLLNNIMLIGFHIFTGATSGSLGASARTPESQIGVSTCTLRFHDVEPHLASTE